MSDTHKRSYEDFDLRVDVDDEKNVLVVFLPVEPTAQLMMDFDTLRDVIDFVGTHGLGMKEVWLNERYAEDLQTSE